MIKYVVSSIIIAFFFSAAGAQPSDTALISQLITNIENEQIQKDSKDFYAGMFPSFRECGGSPHNFSADNNIFYTAVSLFALKNMAPFVTPADRKRISNIVAAAAPVFPRYRNKNGLPLYSFWATNDPIMPHTFIFQYLKSVFGQGDDADDSVMCLMSLDNNENDNRRLKTRLVETSNLSRSKIISTFPRYRNIPAYSTWAGIRMPVDFDFGVHCNILYFMLEKHLPLARQDSATLNVLEQMVKNKDYLSSPVYISPYYVHTSILLYHIARLMGKFKLPQLHHYQPQLVHDINDQLQICNNVMDQIILRTSLLRLGAEAPPMPSFTISEFEKSNQKSFVFFQARAAFSYPTPFKQIFLHWSYIYYYFYCPAYYKILWLEYLVEKEKHR